MGRPLIYNGSIAEKGFRLCFHFLYEIKKEGKGLEENSGLSVHNAILQRYEEHGLLKREGEADGTPFYSEADLRRASHLRVLQKAGMDWATLRRVASLEERPNGKEEQIRLLRRCRCRLLEEIHRKQQLLDRLDYLVYERRMETTKGEESL